MMGFPVVVSDDAKLHGPRVIFNSMNHYRAKWKIECRDGYYELFFGERRVASNSDASTLMELILETEEVPFEFEYPDDEE